MVDPGVQNPQGGPLTAGSRAHSFFGEQIFREVRGVVGAVRHAGLRVSPVPVVYEPFFQKGGASGFDLLVRSSAPTGVVAREMRALVQAMDPTLPVDEVSTMASRIQRSVAEPRFYTVVLSLFGALAVLLALAGCQAGLAHRVAARKREIGIRMALGATMPSVRTMVLRRGLSLTVLGIALGLVAAVPGTRLLESQLYGVTSGDPLTYAGLLLLLLVAGALASDRPARRAAVTDPADVLREG
jgi:predicted lysophospholipase L1 biosynthesis ABC-type transport system permease subunit